MRYLFLLALLVPAFNASARFDHENSYPFYKISTATGFFVFDTTNGTGDRFYTARSVEIKDSSLLRYIYLSLSVSYFYREHRFGAGSPGRHGSQRGLQDRIMRFESFLVNSHNDTLWLYTTVDKFKYRDIRDDFGHVVSTDTSLLIKLDTKKLKHTYYSSIEGKKTQKYEDDLMRYNMSTNNIQEFIDMVNAKTDRRVLEYEFATCGLLFPAPKGFLSTPGTYQCITHITYLNGEQITDCNTIKVKE